MTAKVNREAHKRVTYCTGCDHFEFSEHVACMCDVGTAPVCKTVESCSNCRIDRLHPIFSEILQVFHGS
jgi:hypothetical protein